MRQFVLIKKNKKTKKQKTKKTLQLIKTVLVHVYVRKANGL